MRVLGKLFGFAILMALVAPPVFGGLYFWSDIKSREEEWATSSERFDRLRSVAAFDIAQYPAESRNQFAADAYLGSGTPAILTASLQSRLREFAVQRGVEIVQASELKDDSTDNPFSKLGIRLEMSGPAAGIYDVLQQIEQSKPWLFIDNVQMRSGFVDSVQQQPVEPPMFVGMDVWGVAPRIIDGTKQP
jgi:hypothetical protein